MLKSEAHERWSIANHQGYAEGHERTCYLISIVAQYAPKTADILELGCNVGRNLNGLLCAGFKNLTGVEINQNTHKHRQVLYPELVKRATVHHLPIETYLASDFVEAFDLVYTMAVLEHIHPDSEWVFGELQNLVKPGGHFILIEDETNDIGLDFVFPRSYERLPGFEPVETEDCGHVPGLENSNRMRVFRRA